MVKYLTSRLLIVFLIKFFYSWAFNTNAQLNQFFDFENGFLLESLSYVMTFLIICLGLFIINISFSILHLTQNNSFQEVIEKIGRKGFTNCIKTYIQNFWPELNENFKTEIEVEKYQSLFIVFMLFFLPFSKGNPILNNYYGIYKEFEIEDQGRYGESTEYIENQNYIIHKSKLNEINGRIRSLKENFDEDEPDFDVKKRGYLFVQAGLIDGYKTYYKEYKGIFSYVECLFFSAIEKFINAIMFFLIPYVLCITIYHYKFGSE